MNLYYPSEISKKIKGVTTRMLTDLAEKGVVVPFKESTGAGSPRLYDEENLLQIMFAVALRGMFSHNNMRQLMKKLIEKAKEPVVFMILNHVNRTRINEKIYVNFIYEGEKISMKDLKVGFTTFTQSDVDKYMSVHVNLAGMKKFIAKNF
jgi:DNA-binding transcriptional MerR regulator